MIQLDRGIVQELPVVPPAFVLARPGHPREELWASAGDASWQRAVLDESGRVVELTPLEDGAEDGAERFVSFQRLGDAVLAATADRTEDPLPFAYSSSAIRDHARLEITSSGVRVVVCWKCSTISAILGTTASGAIATLDGKGKTSVALLDPETLKTRASRAFRQHGSYELSMLVGTSTVVALRPLREARPRGEHALGRRAADHTADRRREADPDHRQERRAARRVIARSATSRGDHSSGGADAAACQSSRHFTRTDGSSSASSSSGKPATRTSSMTSARSSPPHPVSNALAPERTLS